MCLRRQLPFSFSFFQFVCFQLAAERALCTVVVILSVTSRQPTCSWVLFPHVKGLSVEVIRELFQLWFVFVVFVCSLLRNDECCSCGSKEWVICFPFGLFQKLRSKSLSAKETCLFTASRKLEPAPSGEENIARTFIGERGRGG